MTAGTLLSELEAAVGRRDLHTARWRSVAFNAATWTVKEQEHLSLGYCLTAVTLLHLFAAPGSHFGAMGVEVAAQTLWRLSGTDASRALLVPTDVVALLASLLRAPASTGAAIKCCNVLVQLALRDDMEEAAVAHGAHRHAIWHLEATTELPAALQRIDASAAWARLLAIITFAEANKRAAHASGALPVVLRALAPGSQLAQHPQTAQCLVQVVQHLTVSSDAARVEAVSCGAVQACVALLTGVLGSNEDVVATSLSVLHECVALPAHVLPAIHAGALAAVLTRVEHPTLPGSTPRALTYAVRVLGYVSRSPDGVPALAADGLRAVRVVAALGCSTVTAVRDGAVVEAVAWTTAQLREAGLAIVAPL